MNLIVGCGYLGERVARMWLAQEIPVAAITRSAARAATMRTAGLFPVVADITNPQSLAKLINLVGEHDTVLFAVGYDRNVGHSIEEVYVRGLNHLLAAISPAIRRLIYISSTGVYSQNDGSWIDEDSPAEPTRPGGKACLAAEQLLQAHPMGRKSIILRLAGIYGPSRVPNRADLIAGKPLASDPHSYLNLIHVDDAAQAVLLAEHSPLAPRTYVVADGQPVLRQNYYAKVTELYGVPIPTYASSPTPQQSPQRGSNKRMTIARLRRELTPIWQYPTYASGLAASISEATL